jgi:hypothetical protein
MLNLVLCEQREKYLNLWNFSLRQYFDGLESMAVPRIKHILKVQQMIYEAEIELENHYEDKYAEDLKSAQDQLNLKSAKNQDSNNQLTLTISDGIASPDSTILSGDAEYFPRWLTPTAVHIPCEEMWVAADLWGFEQYLFGYTDLGQRDRMIGMKVPDLPSEDKDEFTWHRGVSWRKRQGEKWAESLGKGLERQLGKKLSLGSSGGGMNIRNTKQSGSVKVETIVVR